MPQNIIQSQFDIRKQVYFSFLGGAPTVGTPPLLLCTIKKFYRDSHLKTPKSSVYFKFSREKKGERYVKHFDAYQHLVVILYAVIKRFDSLREIIDSMFPVARKLAHLGINMMPRRSTLSDANARRPETVFESTYRSLYARYKDELSSDS